MQEHGHEGELKSSKEATKFSYFEENNRYVIKGINGHLSGQFMSDAEEGKISDTNCRSRSRSKSVLTDSQESTQSSTVRSNNKHGSRTDDFDFELTQFTFRRCLHAIFRLDSDSTFGWTLTSSPGPPFGGLPNGCGGRSGCDVVWLT